MPRVALVSNDVQTIFGKAGGVAAFTTRWAQLLRHAGEDVTIVMTHIDHEPMRVDSNWRARYREMGCGLIELQAPPPSQTRFPEVPTMRMAEIAAPVLKGFDIVYAQDWGNALFHLVRERRYSLTSGPVCVTVLHGPSEWEIRSNQRYPELPADLHLAYLERYAARHSDFAASPTGYMVAQLKSLGWKFAAEPEVLGLPISDPERLPISDESAQLQEIVFFGRVERKGIRNFVAALHLLAKTTVDRPRVLLLGEASDPAVLRHALQDVKRAGFRVSHEGSLNVDALGVLRTSARQRLCVVPSPSENHLYTVVEASLIPGLNLIACGGAGVPEILQRAGGQLCDAAPRPLAEKIAERLGAPLRPSELARYDCAAANARWLAFHDRALARGRRRPSRAAVRQEPTVDVCVTYHQKADYLPQLVDALEQQSDSTFHVIAVNDGSPDERSNRVFDEQARRVEHRGWDFHTQENAFVDAARNSAARRGKGDLILFVDSDDVPARTAIARMREAMTLSGSDLLICGGFWFASKRRPFDPVTGNIEVPAYATCVPLGIDLVGGLLNPAVFGGSMFIIRREVFETFGGMRELRGAGHEEWEY